ncbi:hypothetical protein [Streptomyces avermitilis]|uniref:hypothetical protein n=1 Tax=Streptomyces avermitilis TaxID=33903 RepID=UPI0033FB165E
MAWSIDRRAVLLLVCCQLAIGVRAGLQLASTRGKLRYVVKQTFALLHQFTRLAVR